MTKNQGGSSVVYLEGFLHYISQQQSLPNSAQPVTINSSLFTNNVATAMYLSGCDVKFSGSVLFKNNTAENGGAIYASQETRMNIEVEATVTFIDNTARRDGGAIYVDLVCSYKTVIVHMFSLTHLRLEMVAMPYSLIIQPGLLIIQYISMYQDL